MTSIIDLRLITQFTRVFCPLSTGEKLLWDDRRLVALRQTSQCLPGQVLMVGDPSQKDSAGQVTFRSFFARRALEGMARYVVQTPWIGKDSS